jgi:hypothetical protein
VTHGFAYFGEIDVSTVSAQGAIAARNTSFLPALAAEMRQGKPPVLKIYPPSVTSTRATDLSFRADVGSDIPFDEHDTENARQSC